MKLQVDVVGAEETIEKGSSLVFLIDTSGNVISTVQTLQLSSGESHSYDGQFVGKYILIKFQYIAIRVLAD